MIKMITTLLFLLTLSAQAQDSCKIVSFSKIIKINKVLDQSIIKKTNCDEKTLRVFTELISGATGELKAAHLSQILKSEFNSNVSIEPKEIDVQHVKDTLTSLVDMPKNLTLSKTSSLFGKASLNIAEGTSLKAICNSCETAGSKNIKLLVNNKTIWFSVEVLTKRIGYIPLNTISPFSGKLSSSQFRKTYIFDNGRKHLFQDIKNIRFYKATRQLRKGETIKLTDLIPMTIVKPGQNIKVILKGKSISLKSSALSRQPGRIGEYISVYNQKTNKKINGQVVDFNTVMVEL